jgi:hypothetical protein
MNEGHYCDSGRGQNTVKDRPGCRAGCAEDKNGYPPLHLDPKEAWRLCHDMLALLEGPVGDILTGDQMAVAGCYDMITRLEILLEEES